MTPSFGKREASRLTRFCVLALSLSSLASAHGNHRQKPLRKTGGSFDSMFETAASRQQPFTKSTLTKVLAAVGPGDEWQDNIWPYRQPTAWDISTDFPHPRNLQYDVTEGTWLRLDVHPTSGDIVFDMVGDLYCLPGSAISSSGVTKALPILTGVPHDTAPRFSPNGDRIAFTSDAELGVENIWVIPYKGCSQNHAKRAEVNSTTVDENKKTLAEGVKESPEQKQTRLLSEGRHEAIRVTNETFRWVSGGRFHPSGTKIIATKWYTSDRSLGAGEGWQYNVPALGSSDPIYPGSGNRVTGRTLPLGWTVDDYGTQQIGPEENLWYGGDSIIYSKNVGDESTYTYSKDVHKGIYAIFTVNVTSGDQDTLVDSSPGGASRPELSRDQRTLAFVRRVRDKQALVFKDLQTGSLTHIWHGLTYDSSSSWAPMGTYPSFAFTPKDDAVVIWASGQIYRVPLATNDAGEKIPAKDSPKPIKFTAHINLDLADVRKEKFDVVGSDSANTQRVLAFKELSVDDAGRRVVFQAAGKSYYKEVGGNETAIAVPTLLDAPYITPAFVPGSNGTLVTHSRWDDLKLSTFELANLDGKQASELTGLPLGRYFSPVLSGSSGSVRIAWVKHDGDGLSGTIVATAQPGLYVGDVNIALTNSSIPITNIRFVPSQINTGDRVYIRWVSQSSLLIQQSSSSFTVDVDGGEGGSVARATLGSELVVSDPSKTNVAFVELYHVYLAKGSDIADGEAVWAKPGNATKGLARLTVDGGHDLAWNADGTQLFWFLGPSLYHLEVAKLSECGPAVEQDTLTFGISCVRNLLKSENVLVEHSTDIARLKQDAKGKDGLVFYNANILPMGTPTAKVIRNGIVASKGGVITAVGSASSLASLLAQEKSSGSKLIDAQGAYIIPGFLDVHAHWDGAFGVTRFPAKSWELETFLAYGVTTVQNPSADNVDTFWERSRLERGQFVGPRIFSVGDIIYGAGGDVHQEIVDTDQAYEALNRIRAEGGISAIAYKNYNLPSRASRQRLLAAARNVSILCVPEGGMNWDWDITYLTDGMTTHEHSLPVPQLHDDVITLLAKSGTAITPTHLVHYGGAAGEEYLWSHEDVASNDKLRRFTPHDILSQITESTARPAYSWTLFNTTISMAKVVGKGGRTLIGAHGEPPLGRGYHEELFFTKSGGLTNYEVLRAATSDAAETFGLDGSVGSLVKGKLADLVVFKPGVDVLNDNITKTQEIAYVVRGGRVWKADTMEEVWPVEGRKQVMPIINPE